MYQKKINYELCEILVIYFQSCFCPMGRNAPWIYTSEPENSGLQLWPWTQESVFVSVQTGFSEMSSFLHIFERFLCKWSMSSQGPKVLDASLQKSGETTGRFTYFHCDSLPWFPRLKGLYIEVDIFSGCHGFGKHKCLYTWSYCEKCSLLLLE